MDWLLFVLGIVLVYAILAYYIHSRKLWENHISFYGPIMAIKTEKVGFFDWFARYRTFFARQPFIPETRFNAGAAYAEQQLNRPGDRKFKENDQFLWVRLGDLIACSQQGTPRASFTDPQGHPHPLQLWSGFWRTLREADYQQILSQLP